MSLRIRNHDRRRYHDNQTGKHLFWGLALIGAGSIFLCDRLGVMDVDVDMVWHLWPVLIALSGLYDIVTARRPQDVLQGGFRIVLGLWVYVCLEEMWGWTFATAWPVMLIAYGVSTLLRGMIKPSQENSANGDKNRESAS